MKYIALLFIVILLFTACSEKEVIEQYQPPVQEEIIEEVVEEPEIILIEDREEITENRIDVATVTPKCVYGEPGGEIYFKMNNVPRNTFIQLRHPDEKFSTILDKGNLKEGFMTFTICEKCNQADFNLLPDKKYILRIGFNQSTHLEYSNDHLIDTFANSTFTEQVCSSKIKVVAWATKET